MRIKPFLFGLMAFCLPLVVLVLLEGVLQFAGVAYEARTPFQPVPGQEEFLALSPQYARRYFSGFDPGVAFNPFEREKQAETFRIFVLGGSSSAGFPYHFYYGFPARLEARLEAVRAGRRVEVINLGMTAVNSYTLWDLREAVAAQQPDAVLIYAGHNEYYGAFGAGSTFNALGNRPWLKRLTLRLKRTVLYTLLERLLTGTPPRVAEERTLMARAVRDATITEGGAVYAAGIAQFEANMADVLATFREAGVPVYLGTLASNLKDQPPLGEGEAADVAYREGQKQLAEGNTAAARSAFLEAKEQDDIRFRAPEALNERLRRFAEAPGVMLVEVQQAFRQNSPSGIEDDALFDDHLHPNDRGYALMADAFFEALRQHPRLQGTAAPSPEIALDPFEETHAALQIARLEGGYPFDKTVAPEEEARRYQALLSRHLRAGLYDSLAVLSLTRQKPPPEALLEGVQVARSRADTLVVLRLYRALLHWQPFNETLMQEAVGYALAAPRYDGAVAPLALFAANRTHGAFSLNALAALALRQGRLDEASTLLAAVEQQDPASPVMLYNKARLLVLQGDTLGARRYFERYRDAAE